MRKVPIIQIKSDVYHKKEDVEAENIISSIDKEPPTAIVVDIDKDEYNSENSSWFERLITKLKNLFWKQHNNG